MIQKNITIADASNVSDDWLNNNKIICNHIKYYLSYNIFKIYDSDANNIMEFNFIVKPKFIDMIKIKNNI